MKRNSIIVIIFIFLLSCDDKEKQEMANNLTLKENALRQLQESYNTKIEEYQSLSESSRNEKTQLENQATILNEKITSLEEEIKILRESSITPDNQEYVSSIIAEKDRLEGLLEEERLKSATLENTIASLEANFNKKSKKYVENVSAMLIKVYEDLIEIAEQKSIIARDLKKYNEGAKEINLISSIQKNMDIVKKKISDTKYFLENEQMQEDSLGLLNTQITLAKDRITLFEQKTKEQDELILNLMSEINEANKGYVLIETDENLKNSNILIKKGLFGFRKHEVVLENVDIKRCDIVDKSGRTGDLIIIPHQVGRKPKIVSPHQSFAYTLRKQSETVDMLTIRNAKEFWRASNYLVVSLE